MTKKLCLLLHPLTAAAIAASLASCETHGQVGAAATTNGQGMIYGSLAFGNLGPVQDKEPTAIPNLVQENLAKLIAQTNLIPQTNTDQT